MLMVYTGKILRGAQLKLYYVAFIAYAPLPASFSEESRNEQLKRMIHIQVNPITGLTSNWDYDKMDWKVKRWDTPPNPFHQNFEKCKEDD